MDNTKITEELIEACRYGYNYHKTTQFPEMEFDEMAINNFKQLLESKKTDIVKSTIEKEIIVSEDSKTILIKSHLGNKIMKITSSVKINIEYF